MVRRPSPTPESRAKARRIAQALAGMLIEDPLAFTHSQGGSPSESRSQPGTKRCPSCGGAFEGVRRDAHVQLRQCVDCGGIWLEQAEFDDLLEPTIEVAPKTAPDRETLRRAVLPAAAAAQDVEYRSCPVCAKTMKRENFADTSGVMLDRCRPHGLFLDRGELEAIVAFVRSGGLAHAQQLENSREAEEQRRAEWRERESKHDADRALREQLRARMRRALL